MMPVTNPKAWKAVAGSTANIKATVKRLNKLASHFRENKDHLITVAARIEAGCAPRSDPSGLPKFQRWKAQPIMPERLHGVSPACWPSRIEGA